MMILELCIVLASVLIVEQFKMGIRKVKIS